MSNLTPTNPNYNLSFQQLQEYGRGGYFYNTNVDPSMINYVIDTAVHAQRAEDKIEQMKKFDNGFQAALYYGDTETFVLSNHGHPVKLMSFRIIRACRLEKVDDGDKEIVQYALSFNVPDLPALFIDESVYNNDRLFIEKLQEHTRREVFRRPSQKRSAEIIRSVVAKILEKYVLQCFAGWIKDGSSIVYLHFPMDEGLFSTHQGKHSLVYPRRPDMAGQTPEIRACAADSFCRHYVAIHDMVARSIFFLYGHLGMISSLLPEFDHRLHGALYIHCPNPQILDSVKMLFQFFHDAPLDLSQPVDVFEQELWERKDETTLVMDRRTTDYAIHNCATLQSSISTGSFEMHGKGVVLLRSLPVILSSTITDLATFPGCLTVDLSLDKIDLPEVDDEVDSLPADPFAGYRLDFISFVEKNLSLLRQDLRWGMRWAVAEVDEELSQTAAEMLGAFAGIEAFVRRFYHAMSQDALLDTIIPKGWLTDIPGPFLELSAKSDIGTDIAETFLATLRMNVSRLRRVYTRDTFHLNFPPKKARVIFTYGDDICISSAMVTELCQAMRFSRPTVLAALAEAGVLNGRQVNGSTYLTRVSVKRINGTSTPLQVLRIPLARLETFGEMGVLDGKEG